MSQSEARVWPWISATEIAPGHWVYTVPSSRNSMVTYTVTVSPTETKCTCPGFRFNKRCWHCFCASVSLGMSEYHRQVTKAKRTMKGHGA